MMNKSEQINELAMALSKAQALIKGAVKDQNNLFFKSQYADLASVWDACRDALSKNELSVVQCPEQSEGGGVAVETTLLHSSGQYITSRYIMPVKDVTAQSIGSAITYARRYALSAMVGVAPTDDDDGDEATGNNATKKQSAVTYGNKNAKSNDEKKLPQCTEEKFKQNESAWKDLVVNGKTADDLINLLTTKTTLTDAQKEKIKSWELSNENA